MDGLLNMLQSQMILMIYIVCGMYCRKRELIDDTTKVKLIDLILKVTLPCMIFESFNQTLTPQILRQTAMVFAASMCVAAAALIVGKFAYRRYPDNMSSILRYATLVNNSGFLGLPLVQSVFGDTGLLYASIYVIPNRIMMWTAGMSIFTQSDRRTQYRNILLNPCIITVYLGMIRRILDIPVPAFIDTGISKIGGITSPLSMMIIGTMLVGVDWKGLFKPVIFYFSAIRLIFLPIAALGLARLMGFDELTSGVSVVMTAMPAGSTTALLAAKYGADEEFASGLVVSTTVLSLVTAPFLMLLV